MISFEYKLALPCYPWQAYLAGCAHSRSDATVLVNAVSKMFADTNLTNCWINAVDVALQAGYSDNLAIFVAGNREQGGLRWAFRRRAPLGVRLFIVIKIIIIY